MQHWSQIVRAPAGAGAGVRGTQGNPQPVSGLPPALLPGYLNAQDAYYHQQQVGGYYPTWPQVSPQFACEADYLTRMLSAALLTGFLNIQQTARLPSHISPPYSGECFKRHAGTGAAGSSDPPIPLAAVGVGGPYTLIADFTVPANQKGVIRTAGVNIDPEPSRNLIDVRIRVDGQTVAPFDAQRGTVIGGAGTDQSAWLGYPFSIQAPDRDLCINLFANQLVTLEARNTFGVAAIDIAGMMSGWSYPPTLQTGDRTIRGTLTDQR